MASSYVGTKWDAVVPKGQGFQRRLQLAHKAASGDAGAVLAPTSDRRTFYTVASLANVDDITWNLYADKDDPAPIRTFNLGDGLSIVSPSTGGVLDISIAKADIESLPLVDDGRHALTVDYSTTEPVTFLVGDLRIVLEGVDL